MRGSEAMLRKPNTFLPPPPCGRPQLFKPVTNLPSPAKLFISRARLVTGDRTLVGPGENRLRQWSFFVPGSGRSSGESPGRMPGLLFRTLLTGLVAPEPCIDSIAELQMLQKPHPPRTVPNFCARFYGLDSDSERES